MRPSPLLAAVRATAEIITLAAAAGALAAAAGTVHRGRKGSTKADAYAIAAAPVAAPIATAALLLAAAGRLAGASRTTFAVASVSSASALLAAHRVRTKQDFTRPARRLPPDDIPSLRVYLHNVLYSNREHGAAVAEQIRTWHPDVVVLLEAHDTATEGLRPLLGDYPHTTSWKTDTADGYLVLSRYPILGVHAPEPGTSRPPLVFQVAPPGQRPLRIVATHLTAPDRGDKLVSWVREHETLERVLSTYPRDEPLLVVGDFNASHAHAPFRGLLNAAGLRDVTGSTPTWPATWRVRPFYGLDHALLRGPLHCHAHTTLPGAGSDHRALLLDLHART